jgi:hypothetical protein
MSASWKYVPPVTDLDRFMFQIEGMIDLDDEEIRMCKRLFSLRTLFRRRPFTPASKPSASAATFSTRSSGLTRGRRRDEHD